jgi:hypothetical protein
MARARPPATEHVGQPTVILATHVRALLGDRNLLLPYRLGRTVVLFLDIT